MRSEILSDTETAELLETLLDAANRLGWSAVILPKDEANGGGITFGTPEYVNHVETSINIAEPIIGAAKTNLH